MSKETGGPAFPNVEYTQPMGGGNHMMTIIGGMHLRDYFAAKAMQGLLSSNYLYVNLSDMPEFANNSYEIADAMLKARGE